MSAGRALRWCLRFFEENTRQSMTRLVAFLCGLAACAVAWRAPGEAATVTALIGGGAVALLVRKKSDPGAGGDA